MSTIKNSLEYYQSNQSLLSMLSKKKTGNALINQIIADKSLSSCGGALNNSFSAELKAAYGENKEKLEDIGITLGDDGKLAINQDKLEAASVDDLKALFAGSSSYMKTLTESANSINEILSKAMAYKSTNYTAQGLML